ncbi:MAG: ATPase, T2SS/T4P/T4SS family [Acidobacteriota bacterium]
MTGEIFVRAGVIDRGELEIALAENRNRPGESLADTLIRLALANEEDIAKALAMQCGVPYVDLDRIPADPVALSLIPLTLASQKKLIPLKLEGEELSVAMRDPLDMEAIDLASFVSCKKICVCAASAGQIEDAIHRYYNVDESINDFAKDLSPNEMMQVLTQGTSAGEENVQDLKRKSSSAAVIQVVNSILHQGITKRASDIHIEPQDTGAVIRQRIDGVLTESMRIPTWIMPALTSRLKIMGGLDIAERRVPQDGKIKLRVAGRTVDLRVSTLPTQYGEKIVIRILDGAETTPTIGQLGLLPDTLAKVSEIIGQPQGMLLVCGPTGSGKTTTLYSLLNIVARRKLNIVTVEDPIEYVLPGINQVQIHEKAGLTFAKSLRSILRQDPNVVFVGEIRDAETAEIALRAAMTGHLVFSTLHTNSAVATIARLLDLDIDRSLLASALSAVLAQRLLRRICEQCRVAHEPTSNEVKKFEARFGQPLDFVLYRGKGCRECGNSGYRGRIGVYELLTVTPEIGEVIRTEGASEAHLLEAAGPQMRPMAQDALAKLRQGVTTFEEIERVLSLSPRPAAKTATCPSCSATVTATWLACPFCGASLRASPASAPDATGRPSWAASNQTREVVSELGQIRLLLVDDDVHAFEGAIMLLLRNQFAVRTALSAEEALELIRVEKPHLIVTDVVMPGMDGLSLIRTLRHDPDTAAIPILILSQRTEVEDRLRGFEAGTDDYMIKPFSPREMLMRVKAILRRVYRLPELTDAQDSDRR